MKKWISMILVLTMVLSLVCGMGVSAYADEGKPEEAVAEEIAVAMEEAVSAAPAEEPVEESVEEPAETPAEEPAADVETVAAPVFQKAKGFVSGQKYIIGIEKNGTFYAMSNDNGTVKAVATDPSSPSGKSVFWKADVPSNARGVSLQNAEDDSVYLYYDTNAKLVITTDNSSKGNWNYNDGSLSYTGQSTNYVGDINADQTFSFAGDAATVVIYTDGEDLGTASDPGSSDAPGGDAPPDSGDTPPGR